VFFTTEVNIRETIEGHLALCAKEEIDSGRVTTVCGSHDELPVDRGFVYATVCSDCYRPFEAVAEGVRRWKASYTE